MDTQKNLYFDHGQYIFGYDLYSTKQLDPANFIPVDDYSYQRLCDAAEPGILFVKRDGKQGVLTFHSGEIGACGHLIHSSNIFPFIYDKMLLNGHDYGNSIGYVAVRINHNWGILRLEDHCLDKKKRARRPCMMIIPCMYPTKEAAIAKIKPSPDYHPEYGWRDPFKVQVR